MGEDLSELQASRAKNLVRKYADIFARSMSEVLQVTYTKHMLNIPAGTAFAQKIMYQKNLTEPQREWLYKTIDEMEEAQIICRVSEREVKAVSPSTYAPKKTNKQQGLSPIKLCVQANKACKQAGILPLWLTEDENGVMLSRT